MLLGNAEYDDNEKRLIPGVRQIADELTELFRNDQNQEGAGSARMPGSGEAHSGQLLGQRP